MTQQHRRGSAGPRPALVIDGEAVVLARHPRATPMAGPADAAADPPPAERLPFARTRPDAARRRTPPAPDLIFPAEPRQRFAVPAAPRRSVLPRTAWIAGIAALALAVPLAAVSLQADRRDDHARSAATLPAPAPAEKAVQVLYGMPPAPATRLALAGDSRPAPLPAPPGSVYSAPSRLRPAGVARLQPAQNVRDMKAAARRTPTE